MKMMEDDNKNRSCPLLITNMNIMNSSTKLYSISAVSFCLLISLLPCGASAQVVGFPASKTALELRRNVFEQGRKSDQPFANFRLFMKYQLPAGQEGAVHLGQHIKLNLLSGNHVMSIEHEHLDRQAGRLFAMVDGREMMKMSLPVKQTSQYQSTQEEASSLFSMDGDYTVSARFLTEGNGTLFAKCMAEGKWSPNAKALFIRDGRLVFDIGWLGAVSGGPKVNDGKLHHVVLHVRNGDVELFLDGQSVGKKRSFMAEDENDHVFKIGASAQDFGFDWEGGDLQQILFWKGGLRHLALSKLIQDESIDKIKVQPGFDWQARILQIRQAAAGDRVGYGGTFELQRQSRIATIGVGYADGYRRQLGGKATVLIGGKTAPVIGRISMDSITVDVTDLDQNSLRADHAYLIHDAYPIETMAADLGTISYEIMTTLGQRADWRYHGG